MTYVRGQAAYVEETLRRYLDEQLTLLSWKDAANLPFGATVPINLIDTLPTVDQAVDPNTVAMTSGDEQDDREAEMGAAGGGLHTTERVYFIDVFGESQGIALRIADDIKAILTGKLAGTARYQPVRDFVNGGILDGHLMHFEDVVRVKPQNVDYKRHWQVVKLTVIHEFDAAEYGAVGAP